MKHIDRIATGSSTPCTGVATGSQEGSTPRRVSPRGPSLPPGDVPRVQQSVPLLLATTLVAVVSAGDNLDECSTKTKAAINKLEHVSPTLPRRFSWLILSSISR